MSEPLGPLFKKKIHQITFQIKNCIICTLIKFEFADTERIYTEITQSIADRYGKTYTWELKQTLMGFTGQDAAKKLVEGIGLPISPEDYIKESHILYNENFPKANLLPGIESFFITLLSCPLT